MIIVGTAKNIFFYLESLVSEMNLDACQKGLISTERVN